MISSAVLPGKVAVLVRIQLSPASGAYEGLGSRGPLSSSGLLATTAFDIVSLSYMIGTQFISQRVSHSMRAAFIMVNLRRQLPNRFLFELIRILVRRLHLLV